MVVSVTDQATGEPVSEEQLRRAWFAANGRYAPEVLVTFESDWRRAAEILEEALQDHGPDLMKDRWEIEATASKYQIKLGTITPIVYTSMLIHISHFRVCGAHHLDTYHN